MIPFSFFSCIYLGVHSTDDIVWDSEVVIRLITKLLLDGYLTELLAGFNNVHYYKLLVTEKGSNFLVIQDQEVCFHFIVHDLLYMYNYTFIYSFIIFLDFFRCTSLIIFS